MGIGTPNRRLPQRRSTSANPSTSSDVGVHGWILADQHQGWFKLRDRAKIAILVQQRFAGLDRAAGDQAVVAAAGREASPAAARVKVCGVSRQLPGVGGYEPGKSEECPLQLQKGALIPRAAQDFHQHDVRQHDGLLAGQGRSEPARSRRVCVAQMSNPHGAVDNHRRVGRRRTGLPERYVAVASATCTAGWSPAFGS